MSWWQRSRERYEALIAEFGTVAIVTYFTIFFGTWLAFGIAIGMGWQPEGGLGGAGQWGAAYVATKVTQPVRIGATLVITPIAAAIWHHFRPPAEEPAGDPDTPATDPQTDP